jgi:rhamnulokinase
MSTISNGNAKKNFLAFDLGAESGRVMVGAFDGKTLKLTEAHRFANKPVRVGEHLHWNVLSLFDEVVGGLRRAASQAGEIASLGVDTWGVDFALLDANGELIGNPYHYRDAHTDGMMDEAFRRVSRERIFESTGIQFMQLNSLYQLLAITLAQSPALRIADTLLMMPDLFNYWFTGQKACEFTDATTTQFYDPRQRDWASDLLEQLGIPHHFLARIIQPGTDLGALSKSMLRNLDLSTSALTHTRVIAPASHDTGSAVAAVPPTNHNYAYISSGTWSLLGAGVNEPVITPQALEFNFTNEGGVGGAFRLLKNISGMWLVQECRRKWMAQSGADLPYTDLFARAEKADPFVALVDPDHPSFIHPDDMPAAVAEFCAHTGQTLHEDRGAIVRSLLESLALKYRYTIEQLETLLGKRVEVIHIVGGGSQNKLLCQFTADACNRPVFAGPIEATAIGNILVQMMAQGEVASLDEGRAVVRASFPLTAYEPTHPESWASTYERFVKIAELLTLDS